MDKMTEISHAVLPWALHDKISVFLFWAGIQGVAQATLTNIGTATYNGSTYNLIWDDDNNGNSIVWLDYSNRPGIDIMTKWNFQMEWAAGLGSAITDIQTPGYNVIW